MERASRAELINTVNSQRDQLQHYKFKLRDVVAAYKSVVKEKEALESSLSALSTSRQAEAEASAEVQDDVAGEVEIENSGPPDPLGVNKQEGKDEAGSLREQIRTLSSALTTLTQEKNKLEANFIADKKQLRSENDDLQSKLTEERKRTGTQAEGFELQISDLKSRIRTQQLEREREQTDHALMLRELQTLLSTERIVKDALETQLEEAQKNLKESQEKVQQEPPVSEVYERQIQELQNELKMLRDRLKSAEVKANQPSPFVLELQKEMGSMKSDYQHQVEKEQQKAVEAEARLRTQSKQSEERVSSLEAKLSELSQVVGNYERLRFQDQQAISKLRERVSQLDMENSALARAASLSPEKPEDEEERQEPEKILEKIMSLRSVLKSALGKSENAINLSTIFVEDRNKADEESPLCKQYKEELELMKEEFERYKLRAQSVLKNKNKESGPSRETEILKEQVTELRDKLRMSNFHHQEEVAQYQSKMDNLSKALLAQEEKSKADLAQSKAANQKQIGELEVESKKQRQRTVALLAEKDSEIQELRARCGQTSDPDSLRMWSHDGHSGSGYGESGQLTEGSEAHQGEFSEELEAVSRLLNLPKGVQSEAAFLHFAQEKGRMEVEMHGLRKQKRQIETSLRDLQASSLQKEDQLKHEIRGLEERLAEVDRSDSRESANVEYLKNVMVKFLTSSADGQGKRQMMKALMTILQFSPEEKQRVEQVHGRGWWPS
ncbi:GRIP and coiled-coil domain-containing protein 1 [Aplysia californica]|uniref:GRIP and coiled-coil domain-containing protein 1 n=1 Tax=Aplysia californica TaxID=6500 RepID=A0ABM0K9B8_APLCA|nr:GRIP and coiled-coil domain-containing protein 1 [Aplysia californica]